MQVPIFVFIGQRDLSLNGIPHDTPKSSQDIISFFGYHEVFHLVVFIRVNDEKPNHGSYSDYFC